MALSRRITLVVIITLAVVVGAGTAYWYVKIRPYVREVDGKILSIDLGRRRAAIEMTDPRSGGAMEVTGEIPADCEIKIDGRPAEFSDLRVGDKGRVRAVLQRSVRTSDGHRERRIIAEWIRVSRTAAG